MHTKCKSSTKHYQLLLSNLEQIITNPVLNRKTSTASTLHEIADSIHKRSLVIIFSDMFEHLDDIDNILSALQHLKYNRHEVILFHVVDKSKELEFEYENRPYMFVDLESGEKVKLRSNEVKQLYRDQMDEMLSKLKMKCLQYKIDFIPTDINAGYRSILQSYLVKRSKMRI
jgi:hypothetical protein